MIISNKHKFIFIHNPKCAGQSTREALKEYHDSEIRYWDHEFNPTLDRIVDKAHLWAKDICLFEQLDLGQFFVFGFVRNPYDRFISAFSQYGLVNTEYQSIDINDFAAKCINNITIRYDWNLIHFCPQYLFFYKGNKLVADFVGKQETYPENLAFISSVVGFHIEHKVINQSLRDGKPEKTLSPSTLKLINQLYERDFALFNYPMIIADDEEIEKELLTYRSRIERIAPSIAHTFTALDAANRLLREENDKNIERLSRVESALKEAESAKQEAESARKDAEFELQKFFESRSWRYTAALRNIFGIFKA